MKRKRVLFSILLILIAIAGFLLIDDPIFNNNHSENFNPNRLTSNIDNLQINFTPISSYLDGGFSLLAWPGLENNLAIENPEGFFGRMKLETPQDVMTISVGNESDNSRDFILKLFYNYQEISFRVLGAETYETEFIFSVESGYQADIPFQLNDDLSINEMLSKLTVGLFLAPERFTMNTPDLVWEYGLALNFELSYGVDDRLVLEVEEQEPLKLLDGLQFHGLMINDDFTPTLEAAYHPPNPLIVSPNEQVELAFLANATGLLDESLENFLILAMLDWHQIPLNGQPYLNIAAKSNVNVGQHGRFFIRAPEKPGLYEFAALIIPNPTSKNSIDTFFPLEMSFRFTIEVTE